MLYRGERSLNAAIDNLDSFVALAPTPNPAYRVLRLAAQAEVEPDEQPRDGARELHGAEACASIERAFADLIRERGL